MSPFSGAVVNLVLLDGLKLGVALPNADEVPKDVRGKGAMVGTGAAQTEETKLPKLLKISR